MNLTNKYQWFVTIIVLAMMIISFSLATALLMPVENDQVNEKMQESEDEIVRVDMVLYAQDSSPAKPDKPPGKPGGGGKDAKCYELTRAKWKNQNPEPVIINPTNGEITDGDAVVTEITDAIETWDVVTSVDLFGVASKDTSANYGTVYDEKNFIYFGDDFDNDNIIAVCTYWYLRKGRELVEFDIEFNDYWNYKISPATRTSNLDIDIKNVAVHELGHAIGLSDIYRDSCNTVTMYGYIDTSYIETSKTTLEQPDIDGIIDMYGA
jgi:hypothetical protein